MRSTSFLRLFFAAVVACGATANVFAQIQGPSSSLVPFVLPSAPGVTTYSVLSVGDDADPGVGTYRMVGIPDGLGAYDNNDGSFTVLMNHELQAISGAIRDHGARGAFVSKLVVNKSTFAVTAGDDLVQQVSTWNPALNGGLGGYNAAALGIAFGRLCSADLAPASAYFNPISGLGTQNLIFQSGEEVGNEGRQFGHVVTGPAAGTSYELPHLGKFSWENGVANPGSGDKTIVLGTDDSTPGQVYLYVGNKQAVGNDVQRAGLVGGNLYGIKVTGAPTESRANGVDGIAGNFETVPFTLHNLGNVHNQTGAAIQATSVANGVTDFLRPEDIHWNPANAKEAYFVTTDQFSQVEAGTGAQAGKSRLWKLELDDLNNPTGGTIDLVLNGDDIGQMYDNITVTADGKVLMVEDVGNNAHLGRALEYDIATGTLNVLAFHDPARFGTPPLAPWTQDEEASGIIDITDIMGNALGKKWYLLDVQAHYPNGAELVEGGQLLVMSVPEPSSIALLAMGALGLMALAARRRRVAALKLA